MRKNIFCMLVSLLLIQLVVGDDYEQQDWPQLGRDPQHTGYNNISAMFSYNFTWAAPTNNAHTLAIQDGIVYSADAVSHELPKYIYAFNQTNGNQLWNYSPPGWPLGVAVYENLVLSSTGYPGSIIALNRFTGTHVWNRSFTATYEAHPVVEGGVVYGGLNSNYTFALNATNGNIIWDTTIDIQMTRSTPGICDDKIIFSDGDYSRTNHWIAVYKTNGSVAWTKTYCGMHTWHALTAYKNIVYGPTMCFSIYSVNCSDGSQIWNWSWGNPVAHIDAMLAAHDDKIFVTTNWPTYNGYNIYWALDYLNGSEIWNFSCTTCYSYVYGSGALGDGVYYTPTFASKIFALNTTKGEEIWNYSIASAPPRLATVQYENKIGLIIASGGVFALSSQPTTTTTLPTASDGCWSGDLILEGFTESIPNCEYGDACWDGDLTVEGFTVEIQQCTI